VTRLLCAGLATVDLVYRVDRIPGVDEKAQASAVEIAAGGPATNAAVTAAALGADVTLLTAVGAHPLGDLIRSDLEACGVRVIDASPGSPAPPPVSAITVLAATGQRTIVSRNAGDLIVHAPPSGLPDADLTLVDGHHPALARAAARSARRLLIDAGTWRPVFTEILPLAEVVAASAAFRHPSTAAAFPTPPEAARPAPDASSVPARPAPDASSVPARPAPDALRAPSAPAHASADAALAAAVGAPHLVVTHGPDPVRWFSGTTSGTVDVPEVDAVDTAGAGDAFHGALAVALLDKSDLPDCIAFANRVAGIRVAHAGPRAWLAALNQRD
jgi:sugar/nucleoside kinase (ribokinase family)